MRKHGISGGAWSGPTYNDSNNNTVDFALVANIGDVAVTAKLTLMSSPLRRLAVISIRAQQASRELKRPRLRSSARQARKARHRRSSGTTTLNLSGHCLIPARQLMSRQISNGTHRLFAAGHEVI